MQRKLIVAILLLSCVCYTATLKAQYAQEGIKYPRCFVGSTLFLFGNLDKRNPPSFIQFNIGYRITGKDVISIELKTWRYAWSLGIPWGKSREAEEEKFPGYIRERGFAVVYQRFWWKGLYTSVHVMSAWQTFASINGDNVGRGFQIFNTYRAGYHIKFFKGRMFVEPSLAVTHRPFFTDMPKDFKKLDDKWPRYFLGEPGLHFGVNF